MAKTPEQMSSELAEYGRAGGDDQVPDDYILTSWVGVLCWESADGSTTYYSRIEPDMQAMHTSVGLLSVGTQLVNFLLDND